MSIQKLGSLLLIALAASSAAAQTKAPEPDYALTLNYDFGNDLLASAAAIGTDAKKSSYFTPAGKAAGRDGLVLGLKYNF
ncbi:MAG: hypothetical protein ABIN37_12060 [Burkholderiaceae bacterium]